MKTLIWVIKLLAWGLFVALLVGITVGSGLAVGRELIVACAGLFLYLAPIFLAFRQRRK